MKTRRNAARASLTGHVQSVSGSIQVGTTNVVNQVVDISSYSIIYPIEITTCSICDENLSSQNLKVREHITNDHGISQFRYTCRLCNKEYGSINGVSAHFTACKRQALIGNLHHSTTNVSQSQSNIVQTTSSNDLLSLSQVDPLQCVECVISHVIFFAKDTKDLVTHMRTKHPEAYEKSKKVAAKRIAWSTDEDQVLARLETSLKSTQKGQILERLHIEYNKLAAVSNAPTRSKEAIRGRRQQLEYKNVLKVILSSTNPDVDVSSDISDNDDTNISLNNSNSHTQQSNTVASNDSIDKDDLLLEIRKSLELIINNSTTKFSTSMISAVKSFDNPNGIEVTLQLSMLGIHESINNYRDRSNNSSQHTRSRSSTNGKPTRNVKRRDKSRQLGYYQHLYYRNRKKLVAELLDGESPDVKPPPMDIAEDHYKKIWSKTAIDNAPFDQKPCVNGDSLFAPITKTELQWAIKNTKNDSAAGPDHVKLSEIKAIANSDLLVAFNIWLGLQRIPEELKQNKTILIPKGNSDLNNIKNWRPITISSMVLRIYNKIIGYRINQVFKTSDKQVGFKPVNGCGINITWLHSLLKHARSNKNNIYACLIDVSKAFDSVSHQSIIRALKRNGAPPILIDLITDQYTGTSTVITYENVTSEKIDILCGVKQGDPLSSILFNLVIDELFDILGDKYGYSIKDIGQTNARCFADDLGLVSSSRIGMGELLLLTTSFLAARGLAINPGKCVSIGLAKGYKGKKSKIETEPLFSINQVPVPMLGYINNTTRYLGIKFTSIGAVDYKSVKVQINEALNKIVKLKLKAQCKVELLRTYIIPRFIFQLINTELYPSLLYRFDIMIRKTIRKILHLPISLSNEFFYLPIREGGLQFPVLREVVGLAKIKLFKKIVLLNDPLLQHLIETQTGDIKERFITNLELGGSQTADEIKVYKEKLMKDKRASYATKVHSAGQEIFSTCPLTNKWLHGDQKIMKNRIFINSIKLRTNTLETRVTTTRGLQVDKTCRRCKMADESLMHVLQFCSGTKGLRYIRHHRICNKVANKLTQKGYQVYVEKSFPDPNHVGATLRPDLVAIKDNSALVLDVSAIYEVSGATFINTYQRKVDKYTPILPSVKSEFNCEHIQCHGLLIGSRGSYYHQHLRIWHEMGFSPTELKFIAIGCMEDSIKVATTFNQSVLQQTPLLH